MNLCNEVFRGHSCFVEYLPQQCLDRPEVVAVAALWFHQMSVDIVDMQAEGLVGTGQVLADLVVRIRLGLDLDRLAGILERGLEDDGSLAAERRAYQGFQDQQELHRVCRHVQSRLEGKPRYRS